jgi:hypothetical protein
MRKIRPDEKRCVFIHSGLQSSDSETWAEPSSNTAISITSTRQTRGWNTIYGAAETSQREEFLSSLQTMNKDSITVHTESWEEDISEIAGRGTGLSSRARMERPSGFCRNYCTRIQMRWIHCACGGDMVYEEILPGRECLRHLENMKEILTEDYIKRETASFFRQSCSIMIMFSVLRDSMSQIHPPSQRIWRTSGTSSMVSSADPMSPGQIITGSRNGSSWMDTASKRNRGSSTRAGAAITSITIGHMAGRKTRGCGSIRTLCLTMNSRRRNRTRMISTTRQFVTWSMRCFRRRNPEKRPDTSCGGHGMLSKILAFYRKIYIIIGRRTQYINFNSISWIVMGVYVMSFEFGFE